MTLKRLGKFVVFVFLFFLIANVASEFLHMSFDHAVVGCLISMVIFQQMDIWDMSDKLKRDGK